MLCIVSTFLGGRVLTVHAWASLAGCGCIAACVYFCRGGGGRTTTAASGPRDDAAPPTNTDRYVGFVQTYDPANASHHGATPGGHHPHQVPYGGNYPQQGPYGGMQPSAPPYVGTQQQSQVPYGGNQPQGYPPAPAQGVGSSVLCAHGGWALLKLHVSQ